MKHITIDDDDKSIIIKIDGSLTSATVIDDYGVSAKGHAKWNPEDTYSESFGQRLATARALGRYARKVERKMVRG